MDYGSWATAWSAASWTEVVPFLTDLNVEFVPGGKYWLVTSPLIYDDAEQKKGVEVPAGFLTDFASVPRGLWNLFPKVGPWAPAAVVHDFCYRYALYDKKVADLMFLHAMEDLGIGRVTRRLMYLGVRVFGNGSYKD